MKNSYECSELIEELKQDILELGNIDFYAFFETIEGTMFLTDYNFISDVPLEIERDAVVQTLKASKILEILEEQNKII